jgi:4-hydroxy-tetrahydrodipicolinate reductase
MGGRIIHQIVSAGDLTLSGALEWEEFPGLGEDAGLAAGVGTLGVPLTPDASSLEGDVLISFAVPDASLGHARLAVKKGMPIVIGTTGLSNDQRGELDRIGEKIGCVFAPNMSVGVNVTFRLIEEAARLLGEGYDVEVLETHHNQKIDAPSGTAVRMGEILARTLGREYPEDAVFHREGQTGKRPPRAIGMQTLRGGDVAGEHTVYFFGQGERIEITHRATTRDNFASGAVRAARWVVGKEPGVYGMSDVLGL